MSYQRYKPSSVSFTPSATLPVSVADAKSHLRVSGSSEDALVELYIQAAARYLEESHGLLLLDTTVTEIFTDQPGEEQSFSLTRGPVTSLTSITANTVEAPTTFTAPGGTTVLNAAHNRARVYAPDGWEWDFAPWQIKVVYKAGWANAAAIPAPVKLGVLLLVGDLYENRQDAPTGLNTNAHRLLQPYMVIPGV